MIGADSPIKVSDQLTQSCHAVERVYNKWGNKGWKNVWASRKLISTSPYSLVSLSFPRPTNSQTTSHIVRHRLISIILNNMKPISWYPSDHVSANRNLGCKLWFQDSHQSTNSSYIHMTCIYVEYVKRPSQHGLAGQWERYGYNIVYSYSLFLTALANHNDSL